MTPACGWRFAIDRGGTFIDIVGRGPHGQRLVHKVLSRPPGRRRGDPAVAALRDLLGLPANAPMPAGLIEEVRLGTTVATNALLERQVAPVLLLVNRGLADLALIGDQHRPDLFALRIDRPEPLPLQVLEVAGRLAADGEELEPLQLDAVLEDQLRQARAAGFTSLAVALLHSTRNPAHERAIAAWLERRGWGGALLSHQLSGQPRLVPRLHTTIVEAAIRPVLRDYLEGIQADLGSATRLMVMTSSGALQPPDQLLAKDTILSGPAGGLLGAVAAARQAGCGDAPILGFDMGGTSTDVFHLEAASALEALERRSETEIDGLRVQAAMLPIHTVAAGGGSLLQRRDGRLLVGPRSAGSDPGPLCYRRGGPLTVTDANLLLGRLPVQALPHLFGPGGDQPADAAAVRRAFTQLAGAAAADAPNSAAMGRDPHDPGVSAPGVAGPEDRQSAAAAGLCTPAGLAAPGDPDRADRESGDAWREAAAAGAADAIAATDDPLAAERLARGALDIANERMAEAIRRISIQQGHDLREALLVCFGGAGGQHACALATILGMGRVLIHPLAGVLSAWGIGQAPLRQLRERSLRRPLSEALLPGLSQAFSELELEARQGLAAAGADLARLQPRLRASLELRPRGSERGLELEAPAALHQAGPPSASAETLCRTLHQQFEQRHRQRFGYAVAGEELVLERILLELVAEPAPTGAAMATGAAPTAAAPAAAAGRIATERPKQERSRSPAPPDRADADGASAELPAAQLVPLCLGEGESLHWASVPLWQRSDLRSGQQLHGPALVLERTSATVVEPGWAVRVLADGLLLLEHQALACGWGDDPLETSQPGGPATAEQLTSVPGTAATSPGDGPIDPVQLELYNHRFTAIAAQMGVRLQQSSRSVNIRERLDFSCALFDGEGRLVANAPHIPVHLGSMGESVAALRAAVARGDRAAPGPGDAVAANNPYNGGTHLPDITVITPVFAPDGQGDPLLYVACRGHHGDVGGLTPGSMPPFSRVIHDEGLLLDNVDLLRDGVLLEPQWRRLLAAGPHPVRDPDQLLADLQAQVAANRLGVAELQRLMRRHGVDAVLRFMGHVQANAAEAVRRVIDRLDDGAHTLELDDGGRIAVRVSIDRRARRARLDFSGSSAQQEGNGNAPLAITRAVVLYVFRCLVGQDIPLNAGCFAPIELVVPEGCLLHPLPPAAVVAGNVETSQAVANALFAALGVMAAAQGTMNNLSFGNGRCQYYETICGGSGAGVLADGSGFAGASAIQTHMTNSRLTDPEVLEERFPVRLEHFAIRRGSGGAGRWRGGDGVERRLRFLEPMTVALLSGSRRVAPFGLAGGGPGRPGRNTLIRADGSRQQLAGRAQLQLAAGDLLCIETPGGGGYGAAD